MPNAHNIAESGQGPADNTPKKPRRKFFSWLKRVFLAVFIFFLLAAAGLFILLQSGLGGNFLDDKVEAALRQKIGAFADIDIKNAQLSIDDDYHLALEIKHTPIDLRNDKIELSPIGRLRFGFATMPLLRRQAEVIQLEADNASIIIHKQDNDEGFLAALPHDAKQRVDFDAVTEDIFAAAEKLVQEADKIKINTFRFSNIEIRLQSPQEEQKFTVKYFQLRRLRASAELKAQLVWLGQTLNIEGSAALDDQGRALNFTLNGADIPVKLGAADEAQPYLLNGRPNSGFFRLRGLADINLSGENSAAGKTGGKKLAAALNLKQAHSDISIDAGLPTGFSAKAAYSQGSSQIAVQEASVAVGGAEIPFSGAFGYAEGTGGDGLYAFSLESEDALSSPEDSPAEALPFALTVSGGIEALARKVNFNSITLKTEDSALFGQGSIRFGQERWPEIIFVLHSSKMPVDAAKQLWPINISRAARAWVISHLFGGELTDLHMEIAIPEGFYQKGKLPPLLTEQQLHIRTNIANTRSDLIGDLPPLREAYGAIEVKGMNTVVSLDKALAYVGDGQSIHASAGAMSFAWLPGKPLWADLSVHIDGAIGPIGQLLACRPVNAADKVPFNMQTAKGAVSALLKMNFPLYRGAGPAAAAKAAVAMPAADSSAAARAINWAINLRFKDFTPAEPYRGSIHIAAANGQAQLDNHSALIDGNALLNGIPATIHLLYPLTSLEKAAAEQTETAQPQENSETSPAAENTAAALEPGQKEEKIIFHIDDRLRNIVFSGLDNFLQGPISVEVGAESAGRRPVRIDLTNAALQIPWAGWKKGAGIPAAAVMSLPIKADGLKNIDLDDFVLSGANFRLAGKVHLRNGSFAAAEFSQFSLNRTDRLAVSVSRADKTYHIKLNGASFDMRAFIKSLSEATGQDDKSGYAIALTAAIDQVQGFYNENLRNFRAVYNRSSASHENTGINAVSAGGKPLLVQRAKQRGLQQIKLQAEDAGAFLRFMNYYDKVQGGALQSNLQSAGANILTGPVTIRRFAIINEPKLQALASSQKGAAGKKDSSALAVDWAHGRLTKGPNYLALDRGVIRGPSVGATFQGTIYDSTGNIAMTGTYMPAYSLNRVFGDVPVLGALLGNGRDKGLFGITFKIEGKFKAPKVVVNPISAIAPGALRSIFEFKQP